jgi:rubrerythrin
MPSRAQRLQTIALIATHESALADLYQEYASKLPEHTPMFQRLASDEKEHAAAVARFFAATQGAAHFVSPGPIRLQAVRTSLAFIGRCLVESRSEQPTRLSALSIAHGLEQSAIEKRFFEAGESDSEELRTLLDRLAEETVAHRNLLRDALERERRRFQ